LNVAFLGNRGLLDGDHLPFHLRKLGRRLLVTANEKRCRLEDHDSGCGSPAVFCTLAILHAR